MAKMLTSIDALSNGRLICGVGVGWWKEELEMLGVPFHQRGRQADEILRAFKVLWSEENPVAGGRVLSGSASSASRPSRCRSRTPPIWVGGDSPGAFRRVVTLGDGWHATSKTPAQLREALDKLRAAADKAKRPFESIELSIRFGITDAMLAQGKQAVVDVLAEYKRIGLAHIVLEFRRDDLAPHARDPRPRHGDHPARRRRGLRPAGRRWPRSRRPGDSRASCSGSRLDDVPAPVVGTRAPARPRHARQLPGRLR